MRGLRCVAKFPGRSGGASGVTKTGSRLSRRLVSAHGINRLDELLPWNWAPHASVTGSQAAQAAVSMARLRFSRPLTTICLSVETVPTVKSTATRAGRRMFPDIFAMIQNPTGVTAWWTICRGERNQAKTAQRVCVGAF